MMRSSLFWKILSWLFVLLAWSFLFYKLFIFEDANAFLSTLSSIALLPLLLAICLLPLNFFFEAAKWRFLMRSIEPMSYLQAFQSTLFGQVGGFATPYRLGDYLARTTFFRDPSQWHNAFALGLVGSFSLSLVQILLGIIFSPWCFFFSDFFINHWSLSSIILSISALFLSFVVLFSLPFMCRYMVQHSYFSRFKKLYDLELTISALTLSDFLRICLFSLARVLTYSIQLWLVLWACHIPLLGEYVCLIPIYFCLLTILPSLPAADMAVRGSMGLLLFSSLTLPEAGNISQAASATILLWFINAVLPMFVGSICHFFSLRRG